MLHFFSFPGFQVFAPNVPALSPCTFSWQALCYVYHCRTIKLPRKKYRSLKLEQMDRYFCTKFASSLFTSYVDVVCRLFYSLQHRHCYTGKYLPELENLKKEVKLEIARAKRSYKEKLEVQLGNNNSDSARDSMKTI